MKYQFEYQEIKGCEYCPFHEYDRADKRLWCNITDNGVPADFESESSWMLAVDELQMNCPLEVVE